MEFKSNMRKVQRTATHIMDITSDGQTLTISRCDTCQALVLSHNAKKHLEWHDTIMHYIPDFSDSLKED